jgi:mono/diheme cytochrome c family protein
MLKSAIGLLVVAVIAMVSSWTVQQGCRDVQSSWTHLAYFPKRDMRSTVVLWPQREMMRPPDSLSVPITGKEVARSREEVEATFKNPVAADDSSIARGYRKFQKTCIPCHGTTLEGNGPVAAKFIPPPDLLKATTRGRSDGFIYYYIRHGGAIMPSYGAQVTAAEAYDLINYLRHMQKTNPR